MSNEQAIKDIKYLAARFKSVFDLGTTLESISSTDQIIAEQKDALNKVKSELAKEKASYENLKRNVLEAQKDLKEASSKIDELYKEHEEAFKQESINRLKDASIKVDDIINEALSRRDKIDTDLIVSQEKLTNINTEIKSKFTELTELNKTISDIKKKFN